MKTSLFRGAIFFSIDTKKDMEFQTFWFFLCAFSVFNEISVIVMKIFKNYANKFDFAMLSVKRVHCLNKKKNNNKPMFLIIYQCPICPPGKLI